MVNQNFAMKDFDQLLQEEIGDYEGPHGPFICQAPAFFRLLAALLADPALPGRWRPLILAAIAYFILPADIMPEDLSGPAGYADDLFLCAFVVNELRQDQALTEVLERNWNGGGPLHAIGEFARRRNADLTGHKAESGLDFLDDLRRLLLVAVDTSIRWVMVDQAAQALRDRELLDLVRECHAESEIQTKWLTTRIKTAAPQALASGP